MSAPLMWTVLVTSNLACGFLGFLFGRVTRATVDIAEGDPAVSNAPEAKKSKRRFTQNMVVSIAVALVGALTVILGIVSTQSYDRLIGCVVTYSNQLSDALDARTAPARAAFAEMDKIMQAVAENFDKPTAEAAQKIQDAVEHYNNARRVSGEAVRDNPYPDAPRDACSHLL